MDYQEPSKGKLIKLDVGKVKKTKKTVKDTATEAVELGGEVTEVTHAPDYEIQNEILPITMWAEIGNGTNGLRAYAVGLCEAK